MSNMAETWLDSAMVAEVPNIDHLVTENDQPVDNLFSAKQQRLLVEPLYSSWHPAQPFLADANVGIFNAVYQPPIVPDMWLSLDVQADPDIWKKENRAYFMWKFGKPPEVVIEIVSNTKGRETDQKFRKYAQIGVPYYVVFDPQRIVQPEALRIYVLSIRRYVPFTTRQFPEIGLGLALWDGMYEGMTAQWLRWCDLEGSFILTGAELSAQAQQRAEQAQQQAQHERERAERLAAQLRAIGIEPESAA
jgi:Uma2 family endonuclease